MSDQPDITAVRKILFRLILQGTLGIFVFGWAPVWGDMSGEPGHVERPERVIRLIVKANAEMDLPLFQLLGKVLSSKEPANPSAHIGGASLVKFDLSGEWEIQEEDKVYHATLDPQGNGPYNWQEGRIQTEKLTNRLWSGTWHQKGNDREGAFEVLLSEDGNMAEGVWWYVRVGSQKNIPPREWGGTYKFKRLSANPIP